MSSRGSDEVAGRYLERGRVTKVIEPPEQGVGKASQVSPVKMFAGLARPGAAACAQPFGIWRLQMPWELQNVRPEVSRHPCRTLGH